MRKIVSFSLQQTTIDKLTKFAKAFGVSRSSLLEGEIQNRLQPVMPLVERILSKQEQLRNLIGRRQDNE